MTLDAGPAPRRSRFLTLVGFNGIAQVAPILVVLALTPVLVSRLGLDRFGIWSLALIALGTLTSLDGGVSASLARYFAIYAARSERAESARLLTASFILYLLLGALLTLLSFVLAPELVPLLHIPPELETEAVWAFRWLPALAILGLVSDSVAALLQGNGQFQALAGATCTSVGVYAVAVLVLVQPGDHLSALFAAAALRFVTLAIVGLVLARKRLALRRPVLPAWPTIRDVGGYASRMQLAALSGFVNAELDGFVIAAVAPVRYVGLYTIGLQAASGARSVPLYAFSPLLTRLTTTFRKEGRAAAAVEFERLERRWLPNVLGFGVVAVAAIGFSVPVWLGDRYILSGVTAAVLLTGYMVHVSFTGMRTCYVRAIGRPGLEARYSTVWTVCNALLTVPMALLAGMIGVVGATAGTGIFASAYFVALCRRAEGLPLIWPTKRWWFLAVLAACVTVAGELAVLRSGVEGFPGLLLAGVPALAGLGIMLLAERRPTAAGRPGGISLWRRAAYVAVVLIPVAGIAVASTMRGESDPSPVHISALSGSYEARLGSPLSVTAFRISNTSDSTVTIRRVRLAASQPGLHVIGAFAYSGCAACVADSALPPHITAPPGTRAPELIGMTDLRLGRGALVTVILAVRVSRSGRIQVPPLRIDVVGRSRARALQTAPGPELCAGDGC